jgi:hypothetical protein
VADTNGSLFTELLFDSSDELEFRQGGTVGDPYSIYKLIDFLEMLVLGIT